MMRCEFDEKETERYIVYLPISPAGVRMTPHPLAASRTSLKSVVSIEDT
jgi:hypothetical protein